MKNKKEKSFDSVKIMREIREGLSKEYLDNLEMEKKDLKIIRSKCRIKTIGQKLV